MGSGVLTRRRWESNSVEDIKRFTFRTQRIQTGPKLEASFLLTKFPSAGSRCVGCWGRKIIISIIHLWALGTLTSTFMMWSMVLEQRDCYWDNQSLSSWTAEPLYRGTHALYHDSSKKPMLWEVIDSSWKYTMTFFYNDMMPNCLVNISVHTYCLVLLSLVRGGSVWNGQKLVLGFQTGERILVTVEWSVIDRIFITSPSKSRVRCRKGVRKIQELEGEVYSRKFCLEY